MLQHRMGGSVLAGGSRKGKIGGSRKKFTKDERIAERGMRPLRVEGPAEIKQVASDFATQCFWLRHKKVSIQVVDVNSWMKINRG